jgi:hypothetical protein
MIWLSTEIVYWIWITLLKIKIHHILNNTISFWQPLFLCVCWIRFLSDIIEFLNKEESNIQPRLCNLQKGCTRLTAASDKVYQLLVHGRWFSPSTPASSTTKTGRHNIAEILLKVALNTKNQIPRRIGDRFVWVVM